MGAARNPYLGLGSLKSVKTGRLTASVRKAISSSDHVPAEVLPISPT